MESLIVTNLKIVSNLNHRHTLFTAAVGTILLWFDKQVVSMYIRLPTNYLVDYRYLHKAYNFGLVLFFAIDQIIYSHKTVTHKIQN